MTVWLTPERKPFFGGTYFPARDGERGARVGFLTHLRQLKEAYDTQPEKVAARCAPPCCELSLRNPPWFWRPFGDD
jgi:hypothetical protein